MIFLIIDGSNYIILILEYYHAPSTLSKYSLDSTCSIQHLINIHLYWKSFYSADFCANWPMHRSLALVKSCLRAFPPLQRPRCFFQISYWSPAIVLVSAPSSCFTLAVPMRKGPCEGHTLRACEPSSLPSMLNGPWHFGLLQRLCIDKTTLTYCVPSLLLIAVLFIRISRDLNLGQ